MFSALVLGAEEPPTVLFCGPRVMHYAYRCTRSDPALVSLELQLKHPDGSAQVVLAGIKDIAGTNRVTMVHSGTYEWLLHEVRVVTHPNKPPETRHQYTSLGTFASPGSILGQPQWNEAFDGDSVASIQVDLAKAVTLTLQDVQVQGITQILGTNLQGVVWISKGKYLGSLRIEVGETRLEGCEVMSAGTAGWTKVSLRNVKAKGSLGAGGLTNNVVLVHGCEASDLTLHGGMVVAERCKLQRNVTAQARTLAIEGCYFGQTDDSRCTATQVLRLTGNDFYGGEGALSLTAPAAGLFLVNNVFLVPVTCAWLEGTVSETLAISGNSFWNRTALTLPPAAGIAGYRVDGNFWGDPAGPALGEEVPGGNWLGPAGGSCSFMSEETTWLSAGSRTVSGLAEPFSPTRAWVRGVAIGQGVLSPEYVPLLLKGRRTLASFDLRVRMGQMSADRLSFWVSGADGVRHAVPSQGLTSVRRFYPPEAPIRTLDFIVPPQQEDSVTFTLTQRDTNDVENVLYNGVHAFREPAPRALRIGLKLMTVNAWGYPRAFNEAPRPDQDTSTVIQDRLTTAMAAMLPLRKRQDIRIEMLPSAEYCPVFTSLVPLRHNSIYFGLARYLQDELDNENARRVAAQRQPLDLLLAVVPGGSMTDFVGATGFNHPWYPRIAVIEESDPEAALHEFGHALGLYAREQYSLPAGWTEADGCDPWNPDTREVCDIFIDAGAGARFWGASLFVGDADLTFPRVPGGILHCRAGRESGLRDIMGAVNADVMLPITHATFTRRLRDMLEWPLPNMSRSRAEPASDSPAPGTRRLVLEALFVSKSTNTAQPFYPQLVAETICCRVAPAGLPAYAGTDRLYQQLRAYDSSGSLLGTYDVRRAPSVPQEVFQWRQTFDVPENASRYELETSTHTAEFLWPLPGNWQPQLAVTHGLLAGTNVLGPYADLSFGVADAADAPRRLGITLLVSDDGGSAWNPIGDYDGQTSARIWRDSLPVSDNLRFKVMVSDGFQSRESTVGPFRRVESASSVDILYPWAEAVAPQGTAWTLAAAVVSATDPASVRWSSSLDGDLGSGQRLEPVDLSLGEHHLTCTAADGAGRMVSNSVSVLVIETNQTVVDLQVRGDALSLAVENWDPIQGAVDRPQTGKQCEATVQVHNPGATNTMRLRLYCLPPTGETLLLSEQVVETAPLETASIAGAFTPSAPGTYRLRAEARLMSPETLSETNLANNEWTWSFTNQPPVAVGSSARLSAGQTAMIELSALDADGDALAYEIVQLPAHGQITGAPPLISYAAATNYAGTDSITFRASDGLSWSPTATISFQVRASAPSLPREMRVVAQAGQPFYYRIPAVGQNLGFLYSVLPFVFSELKWDAKTGVVTGSPVYPHQDMGLLKVTNSAGLAQGLLSITILSNAVPPEITSASAATATAGSSFSYQIAAQNVPQAYLATNLPSGLFFNEFTGVVSGTPLNAGDFIFSVGASNRFGITWKTVALSVLSSGQPPVFLRLLDTDTYLGQPLDYSLATFCANNPVHWQITGLAPGLVLASDSGRITGIPRAAGSYAPTVTARNATGTTTVSFVLGVRTPSGVPVLVNPGALSATIGVEFRFQIQATERPTAFGAEQLPAGLQVGAGTGLISGKPSALGTYWILLTAANGNGQGGIEVPLTVMPNPDGPLVSDAVLGDAKIGDVLDFVPTVYNNPTHFSASGLPHGLVVDPVTGRITGRFACTGHYVARLLASNSLGVGEGRLYFTVAPDFVGWISVCGLIGTSQNPEADPDEDGYPNLIEYALGGTPDLAEGMPLVQLARGDGSEIVLLFRAWGAGVGNMFTDYQAGGVRYEVESAPTVTGPWGKDPDLFDPTFQMADQTDGTTSLSLSLRDSAVDAMRFIRIRVSQP